MMTNRTIGLICIGAKNANWNADFDGNPRKIGNRYVASPYSIKYAYKNFFDKHNYKVTNLLSYKTTAKKEFLPRNLKERLQYLFEDIAFDDAIKTQRQVFECIDVSCFGAVFAMKGFTRSYTGAVQFTTGINLYKDSQSLLDSVGNQFQNINNADAKQSSCGSRTYLDEAHFFYDFQIDPKNYKAIYDADNEFKGFTNEDYEAFKKASLVAATSYNSVAKAGCYNEFALFVNFKDGSEKYLGNLSDKVKFSKDGFKSIIDLTNYTEQLKDIVDDINSVEIYYNPLATTVVGYEMDKVKLINMVTLKEIEKK